MHPLVSQLRFARSEFVRCLSGVSEDDAVRRIGSMNCLSWIIGHLANQEQYYWAVYAQGKVVVRDLYKLVGYGQPASTPPLEEMWAAWRAITASADEYLDTVTADRLADRLTWRGQVADEDVGTLILRNTYHYFYHTGEAHAIRDTLGHTNLPDFVGDMAAVHYSE